MAYDRSFWIPIESEIGAHWRPFYNEYFIGEINPECLSKLYLSNCDNDEYFDPDDRKIELKSVLPSLELTYYLYQNFGSEIYQFVYSHNEQLFRKRPLDNDELKDWEMFFCNGECHYHSFDEEYFIDDILPAQLDNTVFAKVLDGLEVVQRSKKVRGLLVSAKCPSPRGIATSDYWQETRFEAPFNHLCNLFSLMLLKKIIRKTWPQEGETKPWSSNEFKFINRFFSDNFFSLISDSEKFSSIDPGTIDVRTTTCHPTPEDEFMWRVLTRFVLDFVGELVLFNRYHSLKGSGLCVACSQAFSRRFYGSRQKYCSQQCKDRMKQKRRREMLARKRFLKERKS